MTTSSRTNSKEFNPREVIDREHQQAANLVQQANSLTCVDSTSARDDESSNSDSPDSHDLSFLLAVQSLDATHAVKSDRSLALLDSQNWGRALAQPLAPPRQGLVNLGHPFKTQNNSNPKQGATMNNASNVSAGPGRQPLGTIQGNVQPQRSSRVTARNPHSNQVDLVDDAIQEFDEPPIVNPKSNAPSGLLKPFAQNRSVPFATQQLRAAQNLPPLPEMGSFNPPSASRGPIGSKQTAAVSRDPPLVAQHAVFEESDQFYDQPDQFGSVSGTDPIESHYQFEQTAPMAAPPAKSQFRSQFQPQPAAPPAAQRFNQFQPQPQAPKPSLFPQSHNQSNSSLPLWSHSTQQPPHGQYGQFAAQIPQQFNQPPQQQLIPRQQDQWAANSAPANTAVTASASGSKILVPAERWSGSNYPWSAQLKRLARDVFGHTSFRTHQEAIMNAALSEKDCLVLKPTGGGKSLCFQLPAITTPGVTVVFSPLVSLIADQVAALELHQVRAAQLNATTSKSEASAVHRDLMSGALRLLYITPEKLSASQYMRKTLVDLASQRKLARFVIDEVHAISQWGHDFRVTYRTALTELKTDFPNVPIMALTATASRAVQQDVIRVLKLKVPKSMSDNASAQNTRWQQQSSSDDECQVFAQSFNRPNLFYTVEKKGKDVVTQMSNFIQANYPQQSGIVYCLTRKDCEEVCKQLVEAGHAAAYYHGEVKSSERSDVQREWMKGKVHIMVATIAFGMGVDKREVRFVMHHSMPKSMEGYVQECGRAGRDGAPSHCVLYYSFADKSKAEWMIKQPQSGGQGKDKSGQSVQTAIDKLYDVVSFCENDADCRRQLQLAHFDEDFDRSKCNNCCDNCLAIHESGAEAQLADVSEFAMALVSIVSECERSHQQCKRQTLNDVLRGVDKLAREWGSQAAFGYASKMPPPKATKADVNRLIMLCLAKKILREDSVEHQTSHSDFNVRSFWIHCGSEAANLMNGSLKLTITRKVKPTGSAAKKKNAAAAAAKVNAASNAAASASSSSAPSRTKGKAGSAASPISLTGSLLVSDADTEWGNHTPAKTSSNAKGKAAKKGSSAKATSKQSTSNKSKSASRRQMVSLSSDEDEDTIDDSDVMEIHPLKTSTKASSSAVKGSYATNNVSPGLSTFAYKGAQSASVQGVVDADCFLSELLRDRLASQLAMCRETIADDLRVDPFKICNMEQITKMSRLLPLDEDELTKRVGLASTLAPIARRRMLQCIIEFLTKMPGVPPLPAARRRTLEASLIAIQHAEHKRHFPTASLTVAGAPGQQGRLQRQEVYEPEIKSNQEAQSRTAQASSSATANKQSHQQQLAPAQSNKRKRSADADFSDEHRGQQPFQQQQQNVHRLDTDWEQSATSISSNLDDWLQEQEDQQQEHPIENRNWAAGSGASTSALHRLDEFQEEEIQQQQGTAPVQQQMQQQQSEIGHQFNSIPQDQGEAAPGEQQEVGAVSMPLFDFHPCEDDGIIIEEPDEQQN